MVQKFNPKDCAEKGYVHMFPCFYKYCIKFDMNRSPNTGFEMEQRIINWSCYFRKYIMTFVEIVGLGMYYYLTEFK